MISSEEILLIVDRLHAEGYEASGFPHAEEIKRYKAFEKVYLDPSSLKLEGKIWQPIVDHYAQLATDFPTIVVDENNRIIDGRQRVAGAQKRGDNNIAAYRPIY